MTFYSPPPRRMTQDEPKRSLAGPIVLCVVGIAIIVGGLWCWRKFMLRDDLAGPLAGEDSSVIAMMTENNATDAAKWLDGYEGRSFMGMSRKQGSALLDKLTSMGAVRILTHGGVMTTLLVVQLPTNPSQRKDLFELQRKSYCNVLVPPASDMGQRYLIFGFHP